jgi:hypothetical protein
MLDPQRAVLIEGGDALLGRHKLRAGLVGGPRGPDSLGVVAGQERVASPLEKPPWHARRARGFARSHSSERVVGPVVARANHDLFFEFRTLRTDVFHLACLVSASAYGVEIMETKTP